jgi:hypothetical protein
MNIKRSVFCRYEPWLRSVDFWLRQTTVFDDGGVAVHCAALPTLVEVKVGEQAQPTFTLPPEQAQQFMDELWRVGFRPTEGSGSAGSLAATERHLADMRKIVFKE